MLRTKQQTEATDADAAWRTKLRSSLLLRCWAYLVGAKYVGLDWMTGALRERWIFPDDGRLWNAFGGITTVLEDGDLLIGGAFGMKRVIGT